MYLPPFVHTSEDTASTEWGVTDSMNWRSLTRAGALSEGKGAGEERREGREN